MVIVPLKSLQKLEYVCFKGNPVEQAIPMFKCYIANELPKVKYLDWIQITKEDRERGESLDLNETWKSKNDPFIRSTTHSIFIIHIYYSNLIAKRPSKKGDSGSSSSESKKHGSRSLRPGAISNTEPLNIAEDHKWKVSSLRGKGDFRENPSLLLAKDRSQKDRRKSKRAHDGCNSSSPSPRPRPLRVEEPLVVVEEDDDAGDDDLPPPLRPADHSNIQKLTMNVILDDTHKTRHRRGKVSNSDKQKGNLLAEEQSSLPLSSSLTLQSPRKQGDLDSESTTIVSGEDKKANKKKSYRMSAKLERDSVKALGILAPEGQIDSESSIKPDGDKKKRKTTHRGKSNVERNTVMISLLDEIDKLTAEYNKDTPWINTLTDEADLVSTSPTENDSIPTIDTSDYDDLPPPPQYHQIPQSPSHLLLKSQPQPAVLVTVEKRERKRKEPEKRGSNAINAGDYPSKAAKGKHDISDNAENLLLSLNLGQLPQNKGGFDEFDAKDIDLSELRSRSHNATPRDAGRQRRSRGLSLSSSPCERVSAEELIREMSRAHNATPRKMDSSDTSSPLASPSSLDRRKGKGPMRVHPPKSSPGSGPQQQQQSPQQQPQQLTSQQLMQSLQTPPSLSASSLQISSQQLMSPPPQLSASSPAQLPQPSSQLLTLSSSLSSPPLQMHHSYQQQQQLPPPPPPSHPYQPLPLQPQSPEEIRMRTSNRKKRNSSDPKDSHAKKTINSDLSVRKSRSSSSASSASSASLSRSRSASSNSNKGDDAEADKLGNSPRGSVRNGDTSPVITRSGRLSPQKDRRSEKALGTPGAAAPAGSSKKAVAAAAAKKSAPAAQKSAQEKEGDSIVNEIVRRIKALLFSSSESDKDYLAQITRGVCAVENLVVDKGRVIDDAELLQGLVTDILLGDTGRFTNPAYISLFEKILKALIVLLDKERGTWGPVSQGLSKRAKEAVMLLHTTYRNGNIITMLLLLRTLFLTQKYAKKDKNYDLSSKFYQNRGLVVLVTITRELCSAEEVMLRELSSGQAGGPEAKGKDGNNIKIAVMTLQCVGQILHNPTIGGDAIEEFISILDGESLCLQLFKSFDIVHGNSNFTHYALKVINRIIPSEPNRNRLTNPVAIYVHGDVIEDIIGSLCKESRFRTAKIALDILLKTLFYYETDAVGILKTVAKWFSEYPHVRLEVFYLLNSEYFAQARSEAPDSVRNALIELNIMYSLLNVVAGLFSNSELACEALKFATFFVESMNLGESEEENNICKAFFSMDTLNATKVVNLVRPNDSSQTTRCALNLVSTLMKHDTNTRIKIADIFAHTSFVQSVLPKLLRIKKEGKAVVKCALEITLHITMIQSNSDSEGDFWVKPILSNQNFFKMLTKLVFEQKDFEISHLALKILISLFHYSKFKKYIFLTILFYIILYFYRRII